MRRTATWRWNRMTMMRWCSFRDIQSPTAAVGPQQGRKVFTLQTLPPDEDDSGGSDRVAKEAGFSLHAGVSAEAHQRDKLERLCRYVTRPAVSEKRLAITFRGNIRYQLKTPYRDGTTHMIFEPLDFIAKLAALVPRPRVNLTRFHGVFAPNSKLRVRVTPAKRGRGRKRRQPTGESWLDKTPAESHAAMTWMQRLKRVFNIDIETCERCSGQVKIIACIEDPAVIERILAHLKGKEPSAELAMLPTSGPKRNFLSLMISALNPRASGLFMKLIPSKAPGIPVAMKGPTWATNRAAKKGIFRYPPRTNFRICGPRWC